MDSESLRTASEYLNNLLLARGLLRDSNSIDFVKPSRDSRAQIINLVHDLILRGDRDKEQRERTAHAYKQLQTAEDSRTLEVERLHQKQEEAARTIVQAQSAERVAKEELKKVEKSIRSLQDQNAKLKLTLTQIRAQCNNDIKKRDVELTRLKTHLQGQQRGNRSATVAPSITVTGARRPAFDTSIHDTSDPAYSLRQESNEFLTQLSHDLSEENDRLLNIVRGAVFTLRELLGLQAAARGASDSGIGEDMSRLGDSKTPNSFDALAGDLEVVLTHLKSLLTNPNFVSIEEVEVREHEILRMRTDWEKMEQRWHDLLSMMNSWRRRMDTGGSINKDDLKKGMKMVSPSHEHSEPTISQYTTNEDDNSLVDDSIDEIRRGSAETRVVSQQQSKIPTLKQQPGHTLQSSAVDDPVQHNSDPTDGRVSPKRKRDPLEPPESFDLRPKGVAQRLRSSRDRISVNATDQRQYLLDEIDADDSEELEIPQLTVEEKLSVAAHQAATARVNSHTLDGAADEADDLLGSAVTLGTTTKLNGRLKRRKSTLSRDELAELLNASKS